MRDNVSTTALWDTRAQASLLNEDWRRKFLSEILVRQVEEVLGPGTVIGVATNRSEIPFLGWVGMDF